MAKYYRQQGETKKRKVLRIVRPILLLFLTAVLVGIGFFIFDIFRQQEESVSSSPTTKAVSSSIGTGVQTQETPYFKMQTPIKWRLVANDSKDGRYVYRQFNGPQIEQDLTIEVNNSAQVVLATTHINRVLPIIVNEKGTIDVVSTGLDHCKKVAPDSKNPRLVTMDRVTFPCSPDFTGYEVVVGLVNGSNIMTLPRSDGSAMTYKITYRNLTANPNSQDLLGILKSFETL